MRKVKSPVANRSSVSTRDDRAAGIGLCYVTLDWWGNVAESEGFEPPIALRLCLISSQVHSTGLCHLSACYLTHFKLLTCLGVSTLFTPNALVSVLSRKVDQAIDRRS